MRVPADGTELMTGLLTTAGESVFFGGRSQTEYTLFGPRVLLAARTREGWTTLFPVGGTDPMTGLFTTAGENGLIGDRCQTEYTLSGLGHHAKGWNRGLILSAFHHFSFFFLADLE